MPLNQRVQKFRDLKARWGLRKASTAGLMTLLRPWLMVSEVQVRPHRPLETNYALPPGIEVRRASREELVKATEHMPDQLTVEFIDKALARGDFCTAAFAGDELVAFNWSAMGVAPVGDGLVASYPPGYRYGYKGYTRPDYRGRRLASSIVRHAEQWFLENGHGQTITYIETHNYASLAHNARAGNRRVGYAGYIRAFGLVMPFHTRGAREHGFRFLRRTDRKDTGLTEPHSHNSRA